MWRFWLRAPNNTTATLLLCAFFFNDTATTEIYTLSLHDALPIYQDPQVLAHHRAAAALRRCAAGAARAPGRRTPDGRPARARSQPGVRLTLRDAAQSGRGPPRLPQRQPGRGRARPGGVDTARAAPQFRLAAVRQRHSA